MKIPLVSVCLPNLNTFPYLAERVETIFGQTFNDWELVVSDNHSNDGAWEFFESLARKDNRVLVAQAPREGLYPNWNNCLRRARGAYVYIATSDDTMAPDCLEKMVAALERHRDCDLAHCPLTIIDQGGAKVNEPKWPECTVFAHAIGELANQPHIRRAPYDGLLQLTGMHVTLSMTQLLIRRSLFERAGEFPSKWGSVSDFNWEMKAGLVASTVHVPDTWASWRVHPTQATAAVDVSSPERNRKFEEMIVDAFEQSARCLPPEFMRRLQADGLLEWHRERRVYYAHLREHRGVGERRLFQLGQAVSSTAARSELWGSLCGRPKWPEVAPRQIRAWLESVVGRPVVEPVTP